MQNPVRRVTNEAPSTQGLLILSCLPRPFQRGIHELMQEVLWDFDPDDTDRVFVRIGEWVGFPYAQQSE